MRLIQLGYQLQNLGEKIIADNFDAKNLA